MTIPFDPRTQLRKQISDQVWQRTLNNVRCQVNLKLQAPVNTHVYYQLHAHVWNNVWDILQR
jgi:hypothetical protein